MSPARFTASKSPIKKQEKQKFIKKIFKNLDWENEDIDEIREYLKETPIIIAWNNACKKRIFGLTKKDRVAKSIINHKEKHEILDDLHYGFIFVLYEYTNAVRKDESIGRPSDFIRKAIDKYYGTERKISSSLKKKYNKYNVRNTPKKRLSHTPNIKPRNKSPSPRRSHKSKSSSKRSSKLRWTRKYRDSDEPEQYDDKYRSLVSPLKGDSSYRMGNWKSEAQRKYEHRQENIARGRPAVTPRRSQQRERFLPKYSKHSKSPRVKSNKFNSSLRVKSKSPVKKSNKSKSPSY